MKKIIFMLVAVASAFFALVASPVYAINDESIDVNIILDQSKVKIEHFSSHTIHFAVVEYAFMEDGTRYSELTTLSVVNNTFLVDTSWTAIKLHQVKSLKGQVYYTYMARGTNQIGNFFGVTRRNVVEITTTAAKKVNSNLLDSPSPLAKNIHYFEFYFKFDKPHDDVLYINVDYVLNKYFWFVKTETQNVSAEIIKDVPINISGYRKARIGTTDTYVPEQITRSSLTTNQDATIKADYVATIAPKTSNWDLSDYEVENFAIIKIAYKVNGEFIIDDVVNNPTTPEQDALDWLKQLLDTLEKIQQFLSKIDFNNAFMIGAIIVGIIIFLIVLGPIISLIALLFKAIKLGFTSIINLLKFIFKIPGHFIGLLKFLFVPGKTKKSKYRRRYYT